MIAESSRRRVQGLVAVTPEGGKIARAQAVSPQVEAGNVYLPHPAIAPWVEPFMEECSTFPNGKNDEQVDQMTQALNRLRAMTVLTGRSPLPTLRPPSGDRGWMA